MSKKAPYASGPNVNGDYLRSIWRDADQQNVKHTLFKTTQLARLNQQSHQGYPNKPNQPILKASTQFHVPRFSIQNNRHKMTPSFESRGPFIMQQKRDKPDPKEKEIHPSNTVLALRRVAYNDGLLKQAFSDNPAGLFGQQELAAKRAHATDRIQRAQEVLDAKKERLANNFTKLSAADRARSSVSDRVNRAAKHLDMLQEKLNFLGQSNDEGKDISASLEQFEDSLRAADTQEAEIPTEPSFAFEDLYSGTPQALPLRTVVNDTRLNPVQRMNFIMGELSKLSYPKEDLERLRKLHSHLRVNHSEASFNDFVKAMTLRYENARLDNLGVDLARIMEYNTEERGGRGIHLASGYIYPNPKAYNPEFLLRHKKAEDLFLMHMAQIMEPIATQPRAGAMMERLRERAVDFVTRGNFENIQNMMITMMMDYKMPVVYMNGVDLVLEAIQQLKDGVNLFMDKHALTLIRTGFIAHDLVTLFDHIPTAGEQTLAAIAPTMQRFMEDLAVMGVLLDLKKTETGRRTGEGIFGGVVGPVLNPAWNNGLRSDSPFTVSGLSSDVESMDLDDEFKTMEGMSQEMKARLNESAVMRSINKEIRTRSPELAPLFLDGGGSAASTIGSSLMKQFKGLEVADSTPSPDKKPPLPPPLGPPPLERLVPRRELDLPPPLEAIPGRMDLDEEKKMDTPPRKPFPKDKKKEEVIDLTGTSTPPPDVIDLTGADVEDAIDVEAQKIPMETIDSDAVMEASRTSTDIESRMMVIPADSTPASSMPIFPLPRSMDNPFEKRVTPFSVNISEKRLIPETIRHLRMGGISSTYDNYMKNIGVGDGEGVMRRPRYIHPTTPVLYSYFDTNVDYTLEGGAAWRERKSYIREMVLASHDKEVQFVSMLNGELFTPFNSATMSTYELVPSTHFERIASDANRELGLGLDVAKVKELVGTRQLQALLNYDHFKSSFFTADSLEYTVPVFLEYAHEGMKELLYEAINFHRARILAPEGLDEAHRVHHTRCLQKCGFYGMNLYLSLLDDESRTLMAKVFPQRGSGYVMSPLAYQRLLHLHINYKGDEADYMTPASLLHTFLTTQKITDRSLEGKEFQTRIDQLKPQLLGIQKRLMSANLSGVDLVENIEDALDRFYPIKEGSNTHKFLMRLNGVDVSAVKKVPESFFDELLDQVKSDYMRDAVPDSMFTVRNTTDDPDGLLVVDAKTLTPSEARVFESIPTVARTMMQARYDEMLRASPLSMLVDEKQDLNIPFFPTSVLDLYQQYGDDALGFKNHFYFMYPILMDGPKGGVQDDISGVLSLLYSLPPMVNFKNTFWRESLKGEIPESIEHRNLLPMEFHAKMREFFKSGDMHGNYVNLLKNFFMRSGIKADPTMRPDERYESTMNAITIGHAQRFIRGETINFIPNRDDFTALGYAENHLLFPGSSSALAVVPPPAPPGSGAITKDVIQTTKSRLRPPGPPPPALVSTPTDRESIMSSIRSGVPLRQTGGVPERSVSLRNPRAGAFIDAFGNKLDEAAMLISKRRIAMEVDDEFDENEWS